MPIGNSAAKPSPFTGRRLALAIVLWLGFVAGYLIAARHLLAEFAFSYEWSDLLLSYAGGFVRRGLLGEIAYILHPVFGAQWVIVPLLLMAYLGVAAGVIWLFLRDPDWAGLYYFVAPTGLAFYFWTGAPAFGRRDIFFIAAFLLAMLAIKRLPPWPALAVMCALYLPVGLMHELAWWYFPLAVAALLIVNRDLPSRQVAFLGLAAAVYMGACLALTILFKGTSIQAFSIIRSWQAIIPSAYAGLGAAGFLGQGMSEALQVVAKDALPPRTFWSYVRAIVVTLLPLAIYARHLRLPRDLLRQAACLVAVVAIASTFVIGADWGRFIALGALHFFIVAAVFRPPGRGFGTVSWPWAVVLSLLLIPYALGWRLSIWVTGNIDPAAPGVIAPFLGYIAETYLGANY